ncbi:YwdI family protein [Fictibacillus barbaricus]|uniref:Uncharacterized protein n=1 Tax=Fictibacillus barbaricus TaxID=182136 RepID=A0ABU1U391_9BACL|nr:YwdI family protein [Fictibacillus barbaricus]MDR7073920.1 hypothetical protein [Fictibacillus barbaricus]
MNIPIGQFAKKIEKHVMEIKQLGEHSPKVREHVSAIHALCELMLEAGEEDHLEVKEWIPGYPVQKPKSMGTSTPAKPKKSMMDFDMEDQNDDEEDGNGDSIFDF